MDKLFIYGIFLILIFVFLTIVMWNEDKDWRWTNDRNGANSGTGKPTPNAGGLFQGWWSLSSNTKRKKR